MIWPFTKIKQQEQEIQRLHKAITKQLTGGINLHDLNVKGGELNLTLEGSPLHILADSFAGQFKKSGASNFLTMSFKDRHSSEHFEIIMQKVSGEALSDQLNRFKSELARLTNEPH